MVALNLKSAILITLSYIISFAGAKPVSNCVVPHAQLGPSLGIYERSYCTTESEFDIFFLRGAPLEGNWDPDKCQCVEFKSQLPDGVRSIVFQPGREPQKVSVLLVQNESCDFPPNEKYDERDFHQEAFVFDDLSPMRYRSAWMCKSDHRRRPPSRTKPKTLKDNDGVPQGKGHKPQLKGGGKHKLKELNGNNGEAEKLHALLMGGAGASAAGVWSIIKGLTTADVVEGVAFGLAA